MGCSCRGLASGTLGLRQRWPESKWVPASFTVGMARTVGEALVRFWAGCSSPRAHKGRLKWATDGSWLNDDVRRGTKCACLAIFCQSRSRVYRRGSDQLEASRGVAELEEGRCCGGRMGVEAVRFACLVWASRDDGGVFWASLTPKEAKVGRDKLTGAENGRIGTRRWWGIGEKGEVRVGERESEEEKRKRKRKKEKKMREEISRDRKSVV